MNDKQRSQAQQLMEASSLGLMFPIAIALGFGWGYGMDKLFHTSPWLTWIFTGLGVVAAFVNFFRTAMRSDPSSDGSNSNDGSARQ